MPLPWIENRSAGHSAHLTIATWIATLVAIGVTALYAFQATEQSRKLSDALAAAELVLTREQHLTQLDGLAAAAAHELGTPLSTITLIVREMEKSLDPASPIAADVRTLREQTQRCRDILAKLTQLSSADAPFDRMRISALVEEAVAPHRDFGIAIRIRQTRAGQERAGDPPQSGGAVRPRQHPGERGRLRARDGRGRRLVGFAQCRDRDRRRRPRHRARHPAQDRRALSRRAGPPDSGSGGLGLGIFIARTLLERSGAKVSFRNRIFPAHGAIVHVMWPREAFEIEEPRLEAAN